MLKAASFFCFPAKQGAEGNLRLLTETLACFLPGRAKDLSAPLYNSQFHGHYLETDTWNYNQCVVVSHPPISVSVLPF